MATPKKPVLDKAVFEIRVTRPDIDPSPWRLLAISADSTLPQLHWTIQGAFGAPCITGHRMTIRGTRYEGGKGSRTPLRRVMQIGDTFECDDAAANHRYAAHVVQRYAVPSRRHYPKVLDGGETAQESFPETFHAKAATWRAQDASRGYYPTADMIARPETTPFEHEGGAISATDMESLERLLESIDGAFKTAPELHGFFTAVVSGPMVMPSEWLPLLLGDGDGEWSSIAEMRTAFGLVMEFYNAVTHDVGTSHERFAILLDRIGNGDEEFDSADDWCKGYLRGMALRPDEWRPLLAIPELRTPLHLIIAIGMRDKDDALAQALSADPAFYAKAVAALAPAVAHIREYWRSRLTQAPVGTVERIEPKIPRNDPCPCGSGKKHKRCCGSPLRGI